MVGYGYSPSASIAWRLSVGSVWILALLFNTPVHAASNYDITTLGGGFSPAGINASGWVAGTAGTQAQLFAGRQRTVQPSQSTARAVNDLGQIVGSYDTVDPNTNVKVTHAFRYVDTLRSPNMVDLGTLKFGDHSEAYGINAAGDVVGYSSVPVASTTAKEDHAFLYTNNQMVDLGTFGGVAAYAYDINNQGDIVGKYLSADGVPHAFARWKNGVVAEFKGLENVSSVARAINEQRQIVGYYVTTLGERRAFLYANDMLTELGALTGDTQSEAYDINDSGQIVGVSFSVPNQPRAFFYADQQLIALSSTLGDVAGWSLQTAVGINNSGAITGVGSFVAANFAGQWGYRLSPSTSKQVLAHPKLPLASNPPATSGFGRVVAVRGDFLVVGAPGEGAVHVYQSENNWWIEKQVLTASTPQTFDGFGTSLAFDGSTLVVGSPGRKVGTFTSGAVYVFDARTLPWKQVDELTPSDAPTMNSFGGAVAIDQSRIVVGSTYSNNVAYVFQLEGSRWIEQQRLFTTDPLACCQGLTASFGNSVAVAGDTIVVGGSGSCAVYQGAMFTHPYVFEWSGSKWTQTQRLDPGDLIVNVALSNDYLAVGRGYGNAVDIYQRDVTGVTKQWVLMDSLNSFLAAPQSRNNSCASGGGIDGFGDSLIIDGNRVLVGAARQKVRDVYGVGTAYVFELDPKGVYWVDRDRLTPSVAAQLSYFGGSVALSGSKIVVGAVGSTYSGTPSAVYPYNTQCTGNCADTYSADISVTVQTPNRVSVLDSFWFRITARNNAIANSSVGAQVVVKLASLVEVSVLPNECARAIDTLICSLAALAPSSTKVIDIALQAPSQVGVIQTQVRIEAAGPDPNLANNTQTVFTDVQPLGKPEIKVVEFTPGLSEDSNTHAFMLTRLESAQVVMYLALSSIHLGASGIHLEVLDGTEVKAQQTTPGPVNLGRLNAGAHTITVVARDAQGIEVASTSVSFTVVVLHSSVVLRIPQDRKPIECGPDETVLLDYKQTNWPIESNGRRLLVEWDMGSVAHYDSMTSVVLDLCFLQDGEHWIRLSLVDADHVVVAATPQVYFTVQRATPILEIRAPIPGVTYKKGFDLDVYVRHRAPGTQLLLSLNGAAQGPFEVTRNGNFAIPLQAEQLSEGENVLQARLSNGAQEPLSVHFTVTDDHVTVTSAPSGSGGGGVISATWLITLFLALISQSRLGRDNRDRRCSLFSQ